MSPHPGPSARLAFTLTLALLVALPGTTGAANRWIDDTLSGDLGSLVADPVRPRAYLADNATGELVVLDALAEAVLERIPLSGGVIRDLVVDRSGSRLAIGSDDGIGLLDLAHLDLVERPLPSHVVGHVVSLAFHANGDLFVAVNSSPQGNSPRTLIYVFDPDAQEVLGWFGRLDGGHFFYYPLVRTDGSGTVLYVGEQGLSPASLFILDVAQPAAPRWITRNHADIGSKLQDLAVPQGRPELYLACGYPYGLQVIDLPKLGASQVLPTGAFPRAVAMGLREDSLFLGPNNGYNNHLFQFEAADRSLVMDYPLATEVQYGSPQRRGVAIPPPGKKAFVVHGYSSPYPQYQHLKVQVVDVARAVPAILIRQWSDPAPAGGAVLTVALLSTRVAAGDPFDFDAAALGAALITFGPLNALPLPSPGGGALDVDGDGDLDLVLRFDRAETGIGCDTTSARLSVWGDDGLDSFASVHIASSFCP